LKVKRFLLLAIYRTPAGSSAAPRSTRTGHYVIGIPIAQCTVLHPRADGDHITYFIVAEGNYGWRTVDFASKFRDGLDRLANH
jgi:hypothetical protein